MTVAEVEVSIRARAWFSRLLALAVLGHIIGNPPHRLDVGGLSHLGLAAGAALLLVEPDRKSLLGLVATLQLVTVWFEAPFLGNHWLVVGFVSLAILGTLGPGEPWPRLAPAARWVLLGFYSFAAFAKLNSGFFDPTVSCGVLYANQALSSWGLPTLSSSSPLAPVVAVATAVIELSVPVLLIVPRTRRLGVALGYSFHFLFSLDLSQHFYDFTSVLFPLFALFLDDATLSSFEERVEAHRTASQVVAAYLVALATAAVAPQNGLTDRFVWYGFFAVWIPFGFMLVAWVVRDLNRPSPVAMKLGGPAPALIFALVVLNGLTPYLGAKTGYGFNMYANLETVDGHTNHYVVRRALELVDIEYVRLVDTDDAGLQAYIDHGYLVPERNLRDFLADHPEVNVTYESAGRRVSGDGATLGRRLPVLVEKFDLFRSIDVASPPRCQTGWFVAR
jgi:hypothetical protein